MYKPAEKAAWKGRTDVQDGALGYRWHHVLELLDLSRDFPDGEDGIAFLGFCCDEGVRRNQGRVGAAGAPAAIRTALASLADHLPEHLQLYGCGDVYCSSQKMEEAQVQLSRKVQQLLNRGYRPILLGGGHETAYGHFLGIKAALPATKKLGIIALDAHFDLRSYSPQSNSGSPFLQIADDLKSANQPFHFLCLGVQEAANTRRLFQTVSEVGATFVLADDLQHGLNQEVKETIQAFLAEVDAVYLSIDVGVFAAAFAPGVSAPEALGIAPYVGLDLLKEIMPSQKVISLDVVELNPSLDVDNQTARLAASLIYHAIKLWG